jgi:phage terminase large subunit-like protein
VDVIDPVTDYALAVKGGAIPVCRYVKLATRRHLRDLGPSGKKKGIYFDHDSANAVIDFFKLLPHVKGRQFAGQNLLLEPWQKFIIGSAFGWKLVKTQLRRYRYIYVEVPRKNGKSTIGAGVGLALSFLDAETGGEVYSCATKKDQAKIVHSMAVSMVNKSSLLAAHSKIYVNNIFLPATETRYEPLGADSSTLDGLNPHGIIIDELHAWKGDDLWNVLEDALGSREQPMVFIITTAGFDQEGICFAQREYGLRVIDPRTGFEDDTFFSFVATADKKDDWKSKATWYKANPNLGVSKRLEYMENLCKKAQDMPRKENSFLNKQLDIWTRQEVRWLSVDKWDKSSKKIPEEEIAAAPCFGGLDLSSNRDLTSFALVWPISAGFACRVWFWVPEDTIYERSKEDRVPYDLWVKNGHIETTPGNSIDYDFIRSKINELGDQYDITEIAADRWNAQHIMTQLTGDGFDVFPFGQGFFSMSEPSKQLELCVLKNNLFHGGNPVLRWQIGNVQVQEDAAGNIKPAKNKSKDKIDGVVAMIMALGRAVLYDEEESPYEEHGIRTLSSED